MLGLIFVLIALLLSVFSSLIKKTVLHEKSSHDGSAYSILSFIFGGFYALFIYFFLNGAHQSDVSILLNPKIFLLLLLDVFVWGFGSVFFYPAYKQVQASESTIITSLQGFFALFLGLFIFKTETFSVARIIGGILILAALILLSRSKEKFKIEKYSLLLALSSLIFALGSVLDNIIIANKYFSSVAFLQIFNFGLAAAVVLLFSPKSFRKIAPIYRDKKALVVLFFNSLSTFLMFFFVYQAYKLKIVASQSNMILSSQVVLVVFLGALFFKEKGSFRKKLLAAIITAIGIYLVS